MNPEETVTSFCETLSEDLEASLAFIHDECVYQNMPFPAVTGPEGVRSVLQGFFEITGHVRIETLRQCSTGSLVMNERIDYFSPPKGRAFGLPVSGAFIVEAGKILEWRDYFCMNHFREGTGLDI